MNNLYKGEDFMVRTVKEVAAEFGVSVASVSAKLKKKGITKVGGRYVIDDKTYAWLLSRKGKVGRPQKGLSDN